MDILMTSLFNGASRSNNEMFAGKSSRDCQSLRSDFKMRLAGSATGTLYGHVLIGANSIQPSWSGWQVNMDRVPDVVFIGAFKQHQVKIEIEDSSWVVATICQTAMNVHDGNGKNMKQTWLARWGRGSYFAESITKAGLDEELRDSFFPSNIQQKTLQNGCKWLQPFNKVYKLSPSCSDSQVCQGLKVEKHLRNHYNFSRFAWQGTYENSPWSETDATKADEYAKEEDGLYTVLLCLLLNVLFWLHITFLLIFLDSLRGQHQNRNKTTIHISKFQAIYVMFVCQSVLVRS